MDELLWQSLRHKDVQQIKDELADRNKVTCSVCGAVVDSFDDCFVKDGVVHHKCELRQSDTGQEVTMTLYGGTREEIVAPLLEAKKWIPNPGVISIIVARPGQPETTTDLDNYGDALVYLTNIEFSEDEPDFHVRLIIK